MSRVTAEPARGSRRDRPRRVARAVVFTATFLLVFAALAVSVALVIYTAWQHDLGRGVFALLFAVLSTQMALNWLLWRDDEE